MTPPAWVGRQVNYHADIKMTRFYPMAAAGRRDIACKMPDTRVVNILEVDAVVVVTGTKLQPALRARALIVY